MLRVTVYLDVNNCVGIVLDLIEHKDVIGIHIRATLILFYMVFSPWVKVVNFGEILTREIMLTSQRFTCVHIDPLPTVHVTTALH